MKCLVVTSRSLASQLQRQGGIGAAVAVKTVSTVVTQTAASPTDSGDFLDRVQSLCQGEVLEAAWRMAEPTTRSGAWREAITLLIGAAASADDLLRARRLCLKLFTLDGGREQVPLAVWRSLICAHARAGDVDGAFGLLGTLERASEGNGFELPGAVFEVLIAGLVDSKNLPAAFGAFKRMRTWSLAEPSQRLYAAMVRACGMVRDPEQAQQLFEECAAREQPSPELYEELMIALATRRRTTRAAFRTFHQAVGRGTITVGPRAFAALAAACARDGRVDDVKLLQRRMKAARVKPTLQVRTDIVRTFGTAASRAAARIALTDNATADTGRSGGRKQDDENEKEQGRLMAYAWRTVQEAREEEGQVPAKLFNALLAAYCGSGSASHAEEALHMAADLNCMPDVSSYAIVLDGFKDDPPQFQALWSHMLSNTSISPTSPMLDIALDVAVTANDAAWALSVLENMFTAEVRPSEVTLSRLRASPMASRFQPIKRMLQALHRQSTSKR